MDLGADRVAGAVQAGADLRVRLDDRALRGVDVARRRADPGDGDRRRVGLVHDVPRAVRPVARRPGVGAAREVAPVAVELRRDVGDDDVAGLQRSLVGLPVPFGGVGAEQDVRLGRGRAAAREVERHAGVDLRLDRARAQVRPQLLVDRLDVRAGAPDGLDLLGVLGRAQVHDHVGGRDELEAGLGQRAGAREVEVVLLDADALGAVRASRTASDEPVRLRRVVERLLEPGRARLPTPSRSSVGAISAPSPPRRIATPKNRSSCMPQKPVRYAIEASLVASTASRPASVEQPVERGNACIVRHRRATLLQVRSPS